MIRAILGFAAVAMGGYGGWLLTDNLDRDQLVTAAAWLVAGPVLHDAGLTVVVLAGLALGRRLLPEPARAPAVVGLVVLGSLTVAVLPVLGRFGAVPEETGVLDRPYGTTWLLAAAVTVVAVGVAGLVRSRRRPGEDGH